MRASTGTLTNTGLVRCVPVGWQKKSPRPKSRAVQERTETRRKGRKGERKATLSYTSRPHGTADQWAITSQRMFLSLAEGVNTLFVRGHVPVELTLSHQPQKLV